MLDIKFVRENPEVVKQNIRNKFQDNKLELVDKVLDRNLLKNRFSSGSFFISLRLDSTVYSSFKFTGLKDR